MGFKRGQASSSELVYLMVEVALIAMFIAAVLIRVNQAVNDQTFYQRFFARDTALLADALLAAEGDFALDYHARTSREANLDFYLNQGSFSVVDSRQDNNSSRVEFLFGTGKIVKVVPGSSLESDNPVRSEASNRFVREFSLYKAGNLLNISNSRFDRNVLLSIQGTSEQGKASQDGGG
jgi:hypothetical protein